MRKTITKIVEAACAHQLHNSDLSIEQNKELYGACNNLHGHTYKLECSISGDVQPSGFIMNFVDLKRILNKCFVNKYDHKYLNEILPNIISTCENQVDLIFSDIQKELDDINNSYMINLKVEKITLWETPTNFCTLEA
jgi:6-pyruvoyltetrahydropterin/6-carboxytetrahydropterin synthase